jgi:hypothetical protein
MKKFFLQASPLYILWIVIKPIYEHVKQRKDKLLTETKQISIKKEESISAIKNGRNSIKRN